MIKLVIFDLDGVLVDACEWHRVALNESLKEVANYEISFSDHYGIFNGLPTRVKLEKLTRLGVIEKNMHEKICNLKQEKTIKIIEKKSKVENEKIELIEWLKSQDIQVACFTNSIRKTANLMLKKAGIFEFLEEIVTNQDVENPKPSPEGYLKIMKNLNKKAHETLIIEDSPKGLEAAKASGSKVIEVKNATEVDVQLLEKIFKGNKK